MTEAKKTERNDRRKFLKDLAVAGGATAAIVVSGTAQGDEIEVNHGPDDGDGQDQSRNEKLGQRRGRELALGHVVLVTDFFIGIHIAVYFFRALIQIGHGFLGWYFDNFSGRRHHFCA